MLDADTGALVSEPEADLWFEAVTETERYVTPQGRAVIASMGSTTPGLEGCAAAPLHDARISVESLGPGDYICLRTSDGWIAEIQLLEPIGPSPGVMRVRVRTFGSSSAQPPERHWERIGDIGYRAPLEVLTSFAGGYIAAAGSGDSTAWFSQDGRNWEERQPAEMVPSCPRSPVDAVVAGGYVTAGATNGRAVLLIGGALVFTAETCANDTIGLSGKVAWVTSDGQTWRRSETFGPPHATVSSVWAIPGGWEAALGAWNEPTVIWHSADGLDWREAAVVGPVNSYGLGAASAGGTRLLATRNERDQSVLLISDDGLTWRDIEAPFIPDDSFGFISQIVPPQAGGHGMWLVVESGGDSTIMWTSLDLLHWEHRAFPAQLPISDLVATSLGYLASVEPLCDTLGGDGEVDGGLEGEGGGCSVPESQYTSADGLNWTMVQPAFGYGTLFVDGPAGVLAVDNGVVWRFEPQTAP